MKKKSLIFDLILFSKLKEIRNWYVDIGLKVLNYVRSLTTFLELFRYLIMKVIKQIMLMFMSAFFALNSCLQVRVSLVNNVEGIRKGHLFSQTGILMGKELGLISEPPLIKLSNPLFGPVASYKAQKEVGNHPIQEATFNADLHHHL